jgi:hypothetical protein
MILDTTVLIDLQKEFRREQPGAASRLLETSGEQHFRRVPGLSFRAY